MNRFEVGEVVQRHCRANWFIQEKDQECRELAEWMLEHSEWELGRTNTRTENLTRAVFDYVGRPFDLDSAGAGSLPILEDAAARSAIDALNECGVVIKRIDSELKKALEEGFERWSTHPSFKTWELKLGGWDLEEEKEEKEKDMGNDFRVKAKDVPARIAELARETGLPVHVYTTTALNTNFAMPCFAVGDAGDPVYAIEDTLHALIDRGAAPGDLYECCGLEKRDELDEDMLENGEFADIDLGYAVPGLIESWEKVPEKVVAEAIEALPEVAIDRAATLESGLEGPEEDEGMLV